MPQLAQSFVPPKPPRKHGIALYGLGEDEVPSPNVQPEIPDFDLQAFAPSRLSTPPEAPTPSRLQNMEEELSGMDKPRRLRDRLLTALIDAAPLLAGGLIGGEEGLLGASQGVSEGIDYRRGMRENRRGQLRQDIERERGREAEVEQQGQQRVFAGRLHREREETEERRHLATVSQRERESERETKSREATRRFEVETRIETEQEKREIENRRLDEQGRHNKEMEAARREATDAAAAARAESNARRDESMDLRRYMGEDRARGDYEQEVAPFKEVWTAKKRLDKAVQDDTGASDVAILYNIIKIMDPESVVREGELALARSTGTWIDNLKTLYNRSIGKSDILSPQLRKEYSAMAKKYYEAGMDQKRQIDTKYEGIARQRRFDPRSIVAYHYGYDEQGKPSGGATGSFNLDDYSEFKDYPDGTKAGFHKTRRKWERLPKQ